jgi:hypothetical protein
MDVTKEKSNVFGQIAALRVSAEGYPKKVILNSLQSISQKTNSLDFLTDLLKSLIGFESLKESLVDVLTHNLDEIELDVKKAIKKALKSMVSCSVNPKIPDSFINDGITIELNKIDFLGMFKVDPISDAGKLLYNDVFNLSNSTDFNTFLYNTIQNDGNVDSWGLSTTNNKILDIRFDEYAPSGTNLPNNTINIKPNEHYAINKKLPDLNNDYIDSIQLFNSAKLINNIVESIFGSISIKIDKSKKQIQNEIKIEDIINRIIDCDDDIIIDDSYFTFTNEDLSSIDYRSEIRRKGVDIITTCGDAESTIDFNTLTKLNSDLDSLNNQSQSDNLMEITTTIIRNGLNDLANESANSVGNNDKLNIKINFIEKMLRQVMAAIFNSILAPKLIIILAVNHSIIYGEVFDDTEAFIKKNRVLLTAALQSVRDAVIGILMDKVLKEVKKLVTDNVIKTQIEKVKYKKSQIASLVGVPTDVLRKMAGIIKK